MTGSEQIAHALSIANRIQADLVEYSIPDNESQATHSTTTTALHPRDQMLVSFDARVTDEDLRVATRSRFATEHFADAVEAGVKALNECVRHRSGRSEDGDSLMTVVFSPARPILRIGAGKSKSDESAQRGHMQLCQGVISAWRNPRAHSLLDDEPDRALMMLSTIDDLIAVTKKAVRTRRRA